MSWTGTARFDATKRYRYELTRRWSAGPDMCWIMLNPSMADATTNDPTIRRCIGLATGWGFGGLVAVNLFALCASDPAALRRVDDPVGPGNDEAILGAVERCDRVVVAWGRHGALHARDERVLSLLRHRELHSIGMNKDGSPSHPLYARADVMVDAFTEAVT